MAELTSQNDVGAARAFDLLFRATGLGNMSMLTERYHPLMGSCSL
ncbi:MAG: hypothetical protein RR413_11250 [Christensenellaceae bacterium]